MVPNVGGYLTPAKRFGLSVKSLCNRTLSKAGHLNTFYWGDFDLGNEMCQRVVEHSLSPEQCSDE